MKLPTLLIVDDDPLIRDSLRLILSDEFDIQLAEDRPHAIRLLRDMDIPPQLALVDLDCHQRRTGRMKGSASSPNCWRIRPISRSSRYPARMRKAMRGTHARSAPLSSSPNPAVRRYCANCCAMHCATSKANRPEWTKAVHLAVIGNSSPIQAMRSQIELYARTPYPVLIEGESGSGKELVAEALQRLNGKPDSSYVVLNCAAISPNLLESTLFGHAKGAFTGATNAQVGFFEKAENGSLFLDEIGEMRRN